MIGKLDDIEDKIGVAPRNISSVLMGGEVAGGKDNVVIVVRTIKSVKDRDVLANLKAGNFTETKAGRYTMHEKGDFAFCVPESNVVLYGPPRVA